MRPPRRLAAAAVLGLLAVPAVAQDRDVALTVYSEADPAGFDPQQFLAQQRTGFDSGWVMPTPGFGVVKEERRLALPAGRGQVRLVDVAQHIDPTTVSFVDLDAPDSTVVLGQSFEFDLVSPAKLLERYVDREISLLEERKDEAGNDVAVWSRGTVLSASAGQVVLRTDEGLRFVQAQHPGIRLPSLPDGLITRPTLVWDVDSEVQGERRVRTTYQTGGLTWRADYNVVLAKDAKSADVGAWVTLLNVSGATYENARLKLIAGDVQRIAPKPGMSWDAQDGGPATGGGGGFEEKEFFEYHLYTLPRRVDIPQNATQQIALFPTAAGVTTRKVLVYAGFDMPGWPRGGINANRDLGTRSNTKVDVYVELENSEQNRMGMPLPKGKLRVYQRDDADGTLEFVGEDLIDHTPRDETVRVKLGQSFDVVGERTQTDFDVNTGRKELFESFRIQVRNHKDEPVDVIVREVLYRWSGWEIVESSDTYEKVDSRTLHFPVTVPARGEKTVTYRVRYTW